MRVESDVDEPGLVRYWFAFDVAALAPEKTPGTIVLDGGTPAYRLCGRGVGVTGYDEADCLAITAAVVSPEPLPPIMSATREIDVSSLDLDPQYVGVTAWRGVWYPALNRRGPVLP